MMGNTEAFAWMLILPCVAECIASVWVPAWDFQGADIKVALLNVSGAFLEGLFAAWEGGLPPPRGSLSSAVASLSGSVRSSFLAAYTSWAGMACCAGSFAHEHSSLLSGCAYLGASVVLGLMAHAAGGGFAALLSAGASAQKDDAPSARLAVMAAAVAFIAGTYVVLDRDLQSFDSRSGVDSELPSLISFLDEEDNRLLVGMACAAAGACCGNAIAASIEGYFGSDGAIVSRGTLACNTLFAVLGLSLPIATLRSHPLQRSVLLQSFAGSFCGAASAFAGHCHDSCELWRGGVLRTVRNSLANLATAAAVCLLAYELEWLITHRGLIDGDGDGLVAASELLSFYAAR